MSDSFRSINDADFDSLLAAGTPLLLDFSASWCAPCRVLEPMLAELAPSYAGRLVIAKISMDDNQQVAQRFGITSAPTMLMFRNGQLVDRAVGLLPRPKLQAFIDGNL